MPNEANDVVEEVAEVVIDQATAEADFESGFDDPGTIKDATETPQTETIEVNEEPANEVPEEPAPRFKQITEDEFAALQARAALVDDIKAAQEKQFGTAFGKIGGIERTLGQLSEQLKGGSGVQINDEDLAELKQEYPELAASLVKGLNGALSKVKGGGQVDPATLDQLVQERLTPALQAAQEKWERRQEEKSLSRSHADWLQVVNSDAFKSWKDQQPNRDEINNSEDSHFVSEVISNFKKTLVPPKPKAPQVDPKELRRKQLEASIAPKGSGGHAAGSDGEDDFLNGFKSG